MGRGAATSPSLYGSQLRGPIGSWVVGKGALSRYQEAPHPSPHPILWPATHPLYSAVLRTGSLPGPLSKAVPRTKLLALTPPPASRLPPKAPPFP